MIREGEVVGIGLIETLSAWDIDVAFVPINGRDYFRTERGIIGNTNPPRKTLVTTPVSRATAPGSC
jgi:hypothetical protein